MLRAEPEGKPYIPFVINIDSNRFQWHPLISDELFRRHSFLEFYTFDGRSCFINRALLGTVNSLEITNLILKHNKLESFGKLPELDYHRFERWRTIEKSCWINRCYFLPAMAQTAWLTDNHDLAELVKHTMLNFLRQCPPPEDVMAHWRRVQHRMEFDYNRKTYEEIFLDETDVEYVWYDFQIASRLINFLHSLYFIKDIVVFAPNELETLLNGLHTHGAVLYEQECHLEYQPGNHQSLRQVALLHAATMNPNATESDTWADLALERGIRHILEDFRTDGSLKENAPSYHAFETWHARDILRLASRLNRKVSAEVVERVHQATEMLKAYRRPDGCTLAINDAYPLEPDALLESMNVTPSISLRNICFKDGGLAVFHGDHIYAALDFSDYTGEFSHYHGGKNALIVYVGDCAIIDDPGYCNYDAPQFRACKQGEVHSSLLVDGMADAHNFSSYGFDSWPSIQTKGWQGDTIVTIETSNRPEWRNVRWIRRLECSDSSLVIRDSIDANKEHDYTLNFVLAPNVAVQLLSNHELLLFARNRKLRMAFRNDCAITLESAANHQSDPSSEVICISVKLPKADNAESLTVIECLPS